ncbi:MAG TPA: hypothetical protein VK476_02875 [Flavobacterium sp.]|nr:hypothetical protein [Flavobacterium sp.]
MTKTTFGSEDKDVRVAKLNFKQSVLIAIISAISGISVTYLTVNRSTNSKNGNPVDNFDETTMSESSKQNLYYFKITKVEMEAEGLKFVGVRVHGHISENPIAYPIKTLWANLGTLYNSSNYPLFLEEKKGSYNFDIIALDDKGKVYYFHSMSNYAERYSIEKLPYTQPMRFTLNNNDYNNRMLAYANMEFEIRKDPF